MPLASLEELVGCETRLERENFTCPGHSFAVAFCLAMLIPAMGFESICNTINNKRYISK